MSTTRNSGEAALMDNSHRPSQELPTNGFDAERVSMIEEVPHQKDSSEQEKSWIPKTITPQNTTVDVNGQSSRPSKPKNSAPITITRASNDISPISPHGRTVSDGHKIKGLPETPGAARRSVQFTRETVDNEQADGPSRVVDERSEAQNSRHSLYSKFKALATSPGLIYARSPSATGISSDGRMINSNLLSPKGDHSDAYFPMTVEEDGSEADADAEQSATEQDADKPSVHRKRKKHVHLHEDGIKTAPATPGAPKRPTLLSSHSLASTDEQRPAPLRRATTNDIREEHHAMSEDEGRSHLNADSPSRARSAWRGLSYSQGQRKSTHTTPDGKRPTAMKLLTGLVGHSDITADSPSRRHRMKGDRGTSLSAQKWRQIKQQLKLLGPKKAKDRTIDHEKSAELLAELIAGSPAALMLASMFQRDEHGSKRVPVLLEQLKVKIVDSEYDAKSRESDPTAQTDRHMVFRIELEYGSGLNRMRWTIRRYLRDFANLHLKYKLHFSTQKYVRLKASDDKGMPRFPKSAFPYLKQVRGLEDEIEDDDDEGGNDTEGTATGTERPSQKNRRRSSFVLSRRRSSLNRAPEENNMSGGLGAGGTLAGLVVTSIAKRETYHERQRKKLEVYLQKMIKFMLFRADSNRLCKFLEVSALGVRLAAEGSYHGKEGFLTIQSGKGLDFRKALTPANFKARHTPKWFLVRHSYVVCVDSPEEMHIYDVFLFDEQFTVQPQSSILRKPKQKQIGKAAETASLPQHHRLRLDNSERRMKLLARNERQLQQFEDSMRSMAKVSPWTKANRFGSFAPVRPNCFAQWLVDGRDHMWVVSRAINQAKDVIYIHDLWLSPELYMRRPPAISQKWRLDRLLKRKAEEGVKVFVIVYRNVESAIPIDSQYTKFSLLDLHPNVFVQRSPNQFRQNTFFWAHHEKLCIVDHTLAFVGGIDLCFGRWDTPQHTVTDDKSTGFEASELPKDADHCQLWPGKDYSNPRVQDFFALNKPYEEMYDRSVVPRMPWHDISMQVVGQPARDLTRHFVQRWNYILRQRKPTRPTPFLLPPPDFNPADLEALGLDGTCEVQILRSCGPWSIGTPDKTEFSIMTAYTKTIEESEHFVYMENQFFISSCVTDVTTIKNTIGDALVERVVRAAKNHEAWRAMIVIPLMPGFQNTVDSDGGTSIRLIMQYQFRSICRGESSIFGRLRAQGIEPEDYIQFYGLRAWGKIGPRQRLVTEQLYIHAKCMIVDDRVAIIGSANINERSMLGNRDSECAAIVRDTDMVWSKMNGKPYMVGRFPHTLRVRLMREHLGLDVDKIMEDAQLIEDELQQHVGEKKPTFSPKSTRSDNDVEISQSAKNAAAHSQVDLEHRVYEETLARAEDLSSFNHDIDWEQSENPNLKSNRKLTEDSRVTGNPAHRKDVDGKGADNMNMIEELGYGIGRDSAAVKENKEVLLTDVATEGKRSLRTPLKRGELPRRPTVLDEYEQGNPPLPPRPENQRLSTAQLGLPMLSQLPSLPATDDSDIGGPTLQRSFSESSTGRRHPLANDLRLPMVDKDCMQDPIFDAFALDTWQTVAENNTKIFRAIFRCMPDNEVKSWKEYKEYVAYGERLDEMQGETSSKSKVQSQPGSSHKSGPPGANLLDRKAVLSQAGGLSVEGGTIASGLKDKMKSASQDSNAERVDRNHDELRAWAVEANKAQAERQNRRQSKEETASTEESTPPPTVPESHPSSPTLGDEREPMSDLLVTPQTSEKLTPPFVSYSEAINMNAQSGPKRRRRGTTRSMRREFNATDDIPTKPEAEDLLNLVQGHLVIWPYNWLAKVEEGGNWLYPFDQISPLEIYV